MNRLVPVWLILLMALLAAARLRAAPEATVIPSLNEGYVLRFWESEREAHYPAIQCVAQTGDGYLWAGSYTGMIRFDGRRFAYFHPGWLDPGLGGSVSAMHPQAPHFLWIGTDRGLVRVGPVGNDVYRVDKGVPEKAKTHSILQVGGGQILASVGDLILHLVGDRFEPEMLPPGHRGKEWTLVQDTAGNVYAWSSTAILRREVGGWSVVLEVFDGFRRAYLEDRAQFFLDVASGPFFNFNRPGAKISPGLIHSWWRQGMMCGHKNGYDCIKAFSETDFTDDLKKFDVPTLVIHGDDDQIVPVEASARLSVKLIKNGVLKIYPAARIAWVIRARSRSIKICSISQSPRT